MSLQRVPDGEAVRLSSSQEQLWFLQQLDPQLTAYNLPRVFRLQGPLDTAALSRAFEAVIERHSVVRTRFFERDGVPMQLVLPVVPFALNRIDLSAHLPETREALLQDAVDAVSSHRFDLERPPALVASVIRLGAEEHVLALCLHHIVSDAGSNPILARDLSLAYQLALRQQSPVQLDPLPWNYIDFVQEERTRTQAGELDRGIAYWNRYLGEDVPTLELPLDFARPAEQTFEGASVGFELEPSMRGALLDLCRAERCTPFAILLAAWQVSLARYGGQRGFAVGVPSAGRRSEEAQDVMGFFVTTQIYRARLSPTMTLREVCRQVRADSIAALNYAEVPLDVLLRQRQDGRLSGRTPLFQTMFSLRMGDPVLELEGLEVSPAACSHRSSKFELSLDVLVESRSIKGQLEYNTALFSEDSARRLTGFYLRVLACFAKDPDRPLATLEFLSEPERATLRAWGRGAERHVDPLPIHRLFEQQVKLRGAAPALVYGDEKLSYAELNRRANRLAHRLASLGVRAETRVGIAVERSVEMVVGLLAILKAGGAYVPLDPEYPEDRLRYMMSDSGVRLLLVQTAVLGRLNVPEEVTVLELDSLDVGAESEENPQVELHPENLAYVIYTSGSTGRPKGASNRHRSLLNRLVWMQEAYGLTSQDVVLQKTPFSFDVSVWEFFWPLMYGAQLAVAAPAAHRDAQQLVELIDRHAVTTLHFVPSMLQAFLEHDGIEGCRTLKRIVCSGEALSPEAQNRVFARLPWAGLYNLYGPTEAAIDVTHWTCRTDDHSTVPIGRPIFGTQTAVLDSELNLVPRGVAGELYLGGIGLARGYLHRGAQTAERFVADPFSEDGARLYRTGDLVRWNADGQLEYLGRIDHQVKIRGFRIELGEIESQLLTQSGVRETVVVARPGAGNGTRLIAYVVAADGAALDPAAIRNRLAQVLPDYMVPSAIVQLTKLPVTANGKLDRKTLPEPELTAQAEYEAPRGEVERALASIWSRVLGVERVGRRDNFFELGGHSLLAIQIVSQVRRAFGCELTLRAVFERPTLSTQAELIAGRDMRRGTCTPEFLKLDPKIERPPLSHAQQRLWFLWRLAPSSASLNSAAAFRFIGALNRDAWRFACQFLVARHPALRTVFREAGAQVWQHVLDESVAPTVSFVELSAMGEAAEGDLSELIAQEARQPFDLERSAPLRIKLFQLGMDQHVLCVVMHHIATDGWSIQVMIHDFMVAYAASCAGQIPDLPPLTLRYIDFAAGQREWLQQGEMQRQLDFWTQRLGGVTPLRLASDIAPPAKRSYPCRILRRSFGPAITAALRTVSDSIAATPFMVLLAATAVVMAERMAQDRFLLGTDFANRNHPGTQSLVGFFVNQVALPVDCTSTQSLRELWMQLRNTVLDASDHQDLPFDRLVEHLRVGKRDDGRAPLFHVKVLYQEDMTAALTLPALRVAVYPLDPAEVEIDLIILFQAARDGLHLIMKYDGEWFEAQTLESVSDEIAAVLQAMLERTDTDVAALRAEAARVRHDFEKRRADDKARQLLQWRATLPRRPATSSR